MPVHPTDDDLPERPEYQSVPDEVWDRFLTDDEARIRSTAPKEPSARAREVARRLREQDELAARRAAAERAGLRRLWHRRPPHPAQPPGWRTGPTPRSRAKQRLRGLARVVVPAVIGVGVVLLVMYASVASSWLRSGSGATPPRSVEPTPGTPSATPGRNLATPTAAHPFADSPALHWADGAAGIVPPTAKPVGGLTTAQVAAALADTKRYIVATELDPATLRGGWPAAAERLMAPDSGWTAVVRADFAHPTAAHSPLGYVTRYRPTQLRLATDTVKVHGAMTYEAGPRGSVQIRTDYSFVYPFLPAHGGDGRVSRSISRQSLLMRVYPPALPPGAAGLLWLQDTSKFDFNTSCGVSDGYLHPGFGTGTGPEPTAVHSADPYDLAVPIGRLPKDCAATSRT